MSTPPQNIFQTIGQGLQTATNSLAEDAANNRRQREALISTKIVNEFQSKMSQDMLDRQANWDGVNDPHETNVQAFGQYKDQTLSGIKDQRIRNNVEAHLANYQASYEIASKTQSLSMEGDFQRKLAVENLSYKQAILNSDPSQYDTVMAEYEREAENYRPDLKMKFYDAEKSQLNETYIDASYSALEKQYADITGSKIMTSEELQSNIEALKAKANSKDFYLSPEQRQAKNNYLDDKLTAGIKAISATRKTLIEAQMKAENEALANGRDIKLPPGVTFAEHRSQQIAILKRDNPVAAATAESDTYIAMAAKEAVDLVDEQGFDQATEYLRKLNYDKEAAFASGNNELGNRLEKQIASSQKGVDEKRKALETNSADYFLADPKNSYNASMIWGMTNERNGAPIPFGQKDTSQWISFIYEKAHNKNPDKTKINFLPSSKVAQYQDELSALSTSGDLDGFKKWASALHSEWSGKDELAGGIDVYDSVIKQLNTTNEKGEMTSPAVALALKHVLIDPPNASAIFTLLTAREGGKPTGVLTSVLKDGKGGGKDAVTAAVNVEFAKYEKAFNVYGDFLPGQNPSINTKALITEMVLNSNAKPELFSDARNLKDVVKKVIDMTVAREFTLIKSPAVRGDVAIPIKQMSEGTRAIVSEPMMAVKYLDGMKRGQTPTPMSEILGTRGVQPGSDPITKFDYQHGDGMVLKGTIDPASLVQMDSKVFSQIPMTTVQRGGQTFLVPRVIDGKTVTSEEAAKHFQETNQHLGIFRNRAVAVDYSTKFNRYLSDISTGRKIDPMMAEFGAPVTPTKRNIFEEDKNGFLKSIKYEKAPGEFKELKYQQLLTNSFFVPIENGTKYRLNVKFFNDPGHSAIITGVKEDGKTPIYFDVPKEEIDNSIFPAFKQDILNRRSKQPAYFM
jgi:hypothetical protein